MMTQSSPPLEMVVYMRWYMRWGRKPRADQTTPTKFMILTIMTHNKKRTS